MENGQLIIIGVAAGSMLVTVIVATFNITKWVNNKINRVYGRLDEIKGKNDDIFVRKDICFVKETNNTKAISELKKEVKDGFASIHGRFDVFVTERNKV